MNVKQFFSIENEDLQVHFDLRFDTRYGKVDVEDVYSILTQELEPATNRFFGNLSIDTSSIEVQESVSAVDRLALQVNGSNDDADEQLLLTTTMRPLRKCSNMQFSYCRNLNYNTTSYPNFVGHNDLQEVNDDIIAFR